jgi:uncharacterized membrane protein YeiH
MRAKALAATLAGAAGSVGFLLYAGRDSPQLVMAIIAAWVLAPFAGLILADVMAKRWPAPVRQALYVVMLIVTLCSVAAYWNDFLRPHTPRAAMFVLVPGLSWLFIAAALSLTWWRSRRST